MEESIITTLGNFLKFMINTSPLTPYKCATSLADSKLSLGGVFNTYFLKQRKSHSVKVSTHLT